MLKKIIFRSILFSFALGVLGSCSPFFYQPFGNRKAELGPETQLKKELQSLPEPKERIVVAVYKFRDQTGQYKASNTGASWSTAVTQGATNVLIRTLEESGWFVPIERENISNLLNERKIIRSSREQYNNGGSNVKLPPLLFAGVILEGGIVSYETNVFTGGAGVRYFGADASAQYREDRVSIYLRAVSTSNGKILKTVYTTKSILSQEVSMGVFRYVKFKHLLEAETGFTYNEPTEMAITEAIEKAVMSLIIEGTNDGLWELKNPEEKDSEVFSSYHAEKEENFQKDLMGRKYEQNLRGKLFISLLGSGQFLNSDYSRSYLKSGGAVNMGIALNKSFFLESSFGAYKMHLIENELDEVEFFGDINLVYMANTRGRFSPYISLGVGTLYDLGKPIGVTNREVMPYMSYDAGLEYLLSDKIAITGEAFVNQLFSDYYDGTRSGTFNDNIWGFKMGFKFYLK